MSPSTNGNRIFWTEKLTIKFGGLTAVDEVDVEVREGEILGLIGPNGSGKTTIFNMITGLYTPTGGDFFFEGKSLLGRPPHEIARRGVARTFQSNRLCLDLSVLDNVFIGMHYRQQSWLFQAILRRGRLVSEVKAARRKALELLEIFNPELVDRAGEPAGALPQIDRRDLRYYVQAHEPGDYRIEACHLDTFIKTSFSAWPHVLWAMVMAGN